MFFLMELEHPSLDITGSESDLLKGKRLVLCITGSVAAVRAPELARALMRHGAEVWPVMSNASLRLIQPDLMHWACGHQPLTTLSGAIEHVALAGDVCNKADLVIVAPATANTISKIACGIDDTVVTTVVSTAWGEGIPLLIVPAMHQSLYQHPQVSENISCLERLGISFLKPRLREGKAKIVETEEIVEAVLLLCQRQRLLKGQRVLVTLGRTIEYVDPIRILTNQSSGKMGAALAFVLKLWGAEVTAVCGRTDVPLPTGIRCLYVQTAAQMLAAVREELTTQTYTSLVAAAAVGDWQVKEPAKEKISTHSQNSLVLELIPTPKIIDHVKDWAPSIHLTAFRAVYKLDKAALLEDARKRLQQARADLIVVNDASYPDIAFQAASNEVTVVTAQGEALHLPKDTKLNIARQLVSIISGHLAKKEKGIDLDSV